MPAIIKNIPRIPPNNSGNRGINFPIQDSCGKVVPQAVELCRLIDENVQEEIVIRMQEGQDIVVCDITIVTENPLNPCLVNTGILYSLVLESDVAMTLGQEEDGTDILVVSQ